MKIFKNMPSSRKYAQNMPKYAMENMNEICMYMQKYAAQHMQ